MMRSRSFWIGLVGNLLEHYDAALFGLLAPFLAPLFFPSDNPTFSLISTYALLPVGFLSKPAGALILGWLGDQFGRKRALSISLFGMAAATGCIGCLPTHEQIGAWAPLLLALARALQGFFAAAETTGGVLLVLDKAAPANRCIASSLFDAAGILGILIGSFLVSYWSEGWRWLFWGGALTGAVGAALRWDQTADIGEKIANPFAILGKEWLSVLAICCVAGFSYYNYYLVTIFMNGFLPLVSSLSKSRAMELNTWILGLDLLLLPLFGWIAKKVSQEKLMLVAMGAITILSIPLFQLLEGATMGAALFVRLVLTVLGVALAAPFYSWAYELSSSKHRFLLVAVGTAIGSRLLGAPAPALGLWLYQTSGWTPAAAIPLIFLGIVAGGLFLFLQRKKLEPISTQKV